MTVDLLASEQLMGSLPPRSAPGDTLDLALVDLVMPGENGLEIIHYRTLMAGGPAEYFNGPCFSQLCSRASAHSHTAG